MEQIIKPTLITAFSAKSGKKRLISLINNDRESLGAVLETNPSSIEIEFRDFVEFIDLTARFDKYSAPISLDGLGVMIDDIRSVYQDGVKMTYRFALPALAKGILKITSAGGTGTAVLYNLSGFVK